MLHRLWSRAYLRTYANFANKNEKGKFIKFCCLSDDFRDN